MLAVITQIFGFNPNICVKITMFALYSKAYAYGYNKQFGIIPVNYGTLTASLAGSS
ncbi:MAG: hypothetical protein H6Q13_2662 [Bacteroidetes bacterium]|nr:hypothetical protein [Bacteroidota bacterium]